MSSNLLLTVNGAVTEEVKSRCCKYKVTELASTMILASSDSPSAKYDPDFSMVTVVPETTAPYPDTSIPSFEKVMVTISFGFLPNDIENKNMSNNTCMFIL